MEPLTPKEDAVKPMLGAEIEDEIDGRFATVDVLFKSGFLPATKEQIRADVLNSKSLGWSWSVANCGVYHTAIVLHLDGQPKYSANWGPKSETHIFKLISEVDGEVTFGIEIDASNESVSYKSEVGSIAVGEIDNKSELDEILDRLLTYDKTTYHLVHCNCRDHVLDVLKTMGTSKEELEHIKHEIADIRPAPEWFLKEFAK